MPSFDCELRLITLGSEACKQRPELFHLTKVTLLIINIGQQVVQSFCSQRQAIQRRCGQAGRGMVTLKKQDLVVKSCCDLQTMVDQAQDRRVEMATRWGQWK